MNLWQFGASRRSMTLAAALIGVVSLAIGAHAALNKRALEAGHANAAIQPIDYAAKPSRIALVVGNSNYPDATTPLAQPVNDARALSATLRAQGFDVEMLEDAGREDMRRAVERLKDRVSPDSVVLVFFGGYGVQSGRQSYMIPVDAAIWKESDVRRQGISVEAVLTAIAEKGAHAKLVAIDASRRNPYERRFRRYSHGLAPIAAPENALVISSTAPGKIVDDIAAHNSLMMSELIASLTSEDAGIEAAFAKTKDNVSRASDGQQVPSVSSSLIEDISFRGNGSLARAGS